MCVNVPSLMGFKYRNMLCKVKLALIMLNIGDQDLKYSKHKIVKLFVLLVLP